MKNPNFKAHTCHLLELGDESRYFVLSGGRLRPEKEYLMTQVLGHHKQRTLVGTMITISIPSTGSSSTGMINEVQQVARRYSSS